MPCRVKYLKLSWKFGEGNGKNLFLFWNLISFNWILKIIGVIKLHCWIGKGAALLIVTTQEKNDKIKLIFQNDEIFKFVMKFKCNWLICQPKCMPYANQTSNNHILKFEFLGVVSHFPWNCPHALEDKLFIVHYICIDPIIALYCWG